MAFDGLEDAYEGAAMGVYAETCADKYSFDREAQDAYAIGSLKKAQAAIESGAFASEITPVEVAQRSGTVTIDTDEQPMKARFDKILNYDLPLRKTGPSLQPMPVRSQTVPLQWCLCVSPKLQSEDSLRLRVS
jgi:acetyl-CoA C-acetyltransferase